MAVSSPFMIDIGLVTNLYFHILFAALSLYLFYTLAAPFLLLNLWSR